MIGIDRVLGVTYPNLSDDNLAHYVVEIDGALFSCHKDTIKGFIFHFLFLLSENIIRDKYTWVEHR